MSSPTTATRKGDSMINRLLVANRGEIARRVFATCRRLGIETVAVHSDADSGLPFVREADVAVRLPGNTPAETYLQSDLVLDAARRAGADAVHPGYGFLSESADFARAVVGAGLTWLGPDPESIEQMGSKVAAKVLMEAAGVPVLANHTVESATESDLPLLVKASAGGGGRGMRVVRTLGELPGQVELAAAEALSAFGDATVFVEAYVERGRHIEVQVFGDHSGNISVLGERDCSIQRRHQKVVEEAPAPGLPAAVAEAMYAAARSAAEAIHYRGAGTVEFLYDADAERFFFLEMNTRLQVEHPVTEAVTGLDLVELQIRAAEGGGALAIHVDQPRGHAIEVRLYAEDPGNDWQPQSGLLADFDIPEVAAEFARSSSYGIRLDSGFETGSEVSTYYDAMLAKVISWAPTRQLAARQLAGVLSRARIHGITTNRDLLVATLRDQAFLDEQVGTDFFERRGLPTAAVPGPDEALLFAAAVALAEDTGVTRTVQRGIPVGWRNVVSAPQRVTLVDDEAAEHVVEWYGGRTGYSGIRDVRVLAASRTGVRLEIDGVASYTDVHIGDPDTLGEREVYLDGAHGSVRLRARPRFVDPAAQVSAGSLLAPMPGTVVRVAVTAGDQISAGSTVLVLEAMKMQHTVSAPTDGTVTELSVKPGDQVAAGEVLAVVVPDPDPDGTEGADQ